MPSRVCRYKLCSESLEGARKNQQYCSKEHRRKEHYRQKSANKLNKKRYNERHGIRRKTIKRKVATTNYAVPNQDLIYENYKEPLKRIPASEGHGYYGVIATTADREAIQCHLCGNLYKSLGQHLRGHNITADKYKERFGLPISAALVGESRREEMQRRVFERRGGGYTGLPAHLAEYNRKVQSGEIRHQAHGKTSMSLEKRNKLGLCPDQVLEKIKDLAKELGHTPSHDEFRLHYKGRYISSIKHLHGSYLNAVRKARLTPAHELWSPSEEKLIAELKEFYKLHKRIPMTSDFNRGLLRNRGLYIARFGTLNNARVAAGLNAVLPLPFGQHVELTPAEYERYKEGRAIEGKVSKQALKKRERRIMRKIERGYA